MTEDVHLGLGTYILGGLSDSERLAFDDHLALCARCRAELADLGQVADVLARVPAGSLHAGADADALVGEQALGTLLSIVRARRRRTRIIRWVVAAAAVCVIAGAGVVGLLSQRAPGTPAAGPLLAMTAGKGSATAAQISITRKGWGTAITLHADALPTAGTFRLEAIADDGTVEPAASWGATTTGRANVNGATSIQAEDLGQIRILGPNDAVIATLAM
jgi:hypothetical protein